jgi:hypothetical protein
MFVFPTLRQCFWIYLSSTDFVVCAITVVDKHALYIVKKKIAVHPNYSIFGPYIFLVIYALLTTSVV